MGVGEWRAQKVWGIKQGCFALLQGGSYLQLHPLAKKKSGETRKRQARIQEQCCLILFAQAGEQFAVILFFGCVRKLCIYLLIFLDLQRDASKGRTQAAKGKATISGRNVHIFILSTPYFCRAPRQFHQNLIIFKTFCSIPPPVLSLTPPGQRPRPRTSRPGSPTARLR